MSHVDFEDSAIGHVQLLSLRFHGRKPGQAKLAEVRDQVGDSVSEGLRARARHHIHVQKYIGVFLERI